MPLEYEILETLPQEHDHLCKVTVPVMTKDGEHLHVASALMWGRSCVADYPAMGFISMRRDWPGIALGGVVANSDSLLIVHAILKGIIERRLKPQEKVEMLPLTILNHKGRVAGEDYFIINPVGTVDCLDYDRSAIKRMPDGRIISVKKFVLNREKIRWQPTVFRPMDKPHEYIIDGDITTEFMETGFKDRNVFVDGIEIV